MDSPDSIESSLDQTACSHSSISMDDSSSVTSSSDDALFSADKIKNLLLYQKQKYQILKNDSATSARWWRCFGFPSRLGENNVLRKIPGFISCLKCMHTLAYNHSSGTTRFKEHADKCFPLPKSSVRQFSAAGLILNERRTNLSPHQLDNILLIRSVNKLN